MLEPIPSRHWARGRYTLDTHQGQFRDFSMMNVHVFGLWEQTRMPGENPHRTQELGANGTQKYLKLGLEPRTFLVKNNCASRATRFKQINNPNL